MLFKLYKYTTKDGHIDYDIPIYQEGDKYIYYEYDVNGKVWLGPHGVFIRRWFGPETDKEPYTFNIIPGEVLKDLIMKLFKET